MLSVKGAVILVTTDMTKTIVGLFCPGVAVDGQWLSCSVGYFDSHVQIKQGVTKR